MIFARANTKLADGTHFDTQQQRNSVFEGCIQFLSPSISPSSQSSSSTTHSWPVPNGYPNPTRYPVFSSIPDPTRFNFENLRVAGNPKYRVLPEVSGNTRSFGYYPEFRVLPDVSGCKLFVNYPEYPELPGNTRNTRNYPRVKKIPENTRSYFSTLLPDPNPTRYPVFFPIPDPTRPDIEKPYPLGTAARSSSSQ